jgi:SAM-dependent methyltransferase
MMNRAGLISGVPALPNKRMPVRPTRCAICQTLGNADEMYPAKCSADAFQPAVFSARRLPDGIHYRLVRCHDCGLVRSDPIVDMPLLNELYSRSTFDYAAEIQNLRRTYGRYLAWAQRLAQRRDSLLEIGCGNGFFLEEALEQGFREVTGVEPSAAAIAAAPPRLRSSIVCDVMRPGLFPPERFDLICLFQVFDHLPFPAELLAECRRILRPGGLVLALNHNIAALSARVLGERSPIIDIEHTYLYSPATMARIFTTARFEILEQGTVWNSYTVNYLVRLLPLPALPKRVLLKLLGATSLGKLGVRLPLGNLYQIARKPHERTRTDSVPSVARL